jgi:hypothetical protein
MAIFLVGSSSIGLSNEEILDRVPETQSYFGALDRDLNFATVKKIMIPAWLIQQPCIPKLLNKIWSIVNVVRGDHLQVNPDVHQLQCDSLYKDQQVIITMTTNPRRIRTLLTRLVPLLP